MTAGFGWQLRCTLGWAWRDFAFEWRVSLCLALAVAAVLAPLLVLFGLKSGIVTTLTTRLKSDPRNLEIVWKLNSPMEPDWVARLRDRSDVGFLVPNTRSLAATVDLIGPQGAGLQDIDMLPTAAGDPLFRDGKTIPGALSEAALSQEAARRLGVTAGDSVEASIVRSYRQKRQTLRFSLRVVSVLQESSFGGKVVFVSVPLLEAAEAYRDGYVVPELGGTEGAAGRPEQHRFSRLRLYARSLDDVAGLAEDLRSAGYDVATRSKDIELVKRLDHALTFLFRLIASVGISGCLLSLGASLWANVERKRRDLALLRLVGVRRRVLAGFPAAQSVFIASGGLLLAFALYAVSAVVINHTFETDLGREEFVCRLIARDGMISVLLTEILAVTASLMGVADVLKIDPAESLREL